MMYLVLYWGWGWCGLGNNSCLDLFQIRPLNINLKKSLGIIKRGSNILANDKRQKYPRWKKVPDVLTGEKARISANRGKKDPQSYKQ